MKNYVGHAVMAMLVLLACMLPAAHALVQRSFVNLGFESPALTPQSPATSCYRQVSSASVPGWDTTHPSQAGSGNCASPGSGTGPLIEMWSSGFNGIPAAEGNNFAELNAEANSSIYQTVCLVQGESFNWRFSHRGRSGNDTMKFTVGGTLPTGSGTVIVGGTTVTQPTSGTGSWSNYSGTFTVPSGFSGDQFIGFTAVSSAGGLTQGNFIDNIQVTLKPIIEFSSANYASGESNGSPAPIVVQVVGIVPAGGLTLQFTVDGSSTATLGTDYTINGGTASTFTRTIPAGDYSTGTTISIPVTLLSDTIIEGDESFKINLTPNASQYTLLSSSVCGNPGNGLATYTIQDDDFPVKLTKVWTNGKPADAVSLAVTGGVSAVAGSSVASGTTTMATATATTGNSITLAETFSTGSASNYNTTLVCRRDTDNSVLTLTGSTFSMPSAAVTCTYTNSRKSATLALRKTWVNAKVNDAATVTATGLSSLSSTANSTSETDSAAAQTVYAGDVITLGETISTGTGNYNASLGCSGNTTAISGSNLTVNAADTAITCTYTNSRIAQQLNLNKQWQNGATAHTINVTTTGGTNNPTLSSTSSGNNSTTGTALTVYAGDSVTLPTETFGGGGSAAQYDSTLACSGGTTLASGAVNRSITITNSTTATVCTYTNARKSATLTLRKTWVNAKLNDAATVTATGLTSLSSVANTASETDTGSAQTVYVGDVITLGETITTGAGNYNASLSCAGNNTALSGNNLTINNSDTVVICTYSNSRIAQQLSLNKQWQNGASGHTINVTSTGGTNNPTLSSTSSGNNSTTGTALTVYAGDSVTLPAETFGGGATSSQYTSTLACSGGTTLGSGAVNRSVTISNSTTATVCTYTNARVSNAIKLTKAWINGKTSDAVSLSITGGSSAVAGSSTVGGTTTNATATGLAGDSITFAEAFTTGSGTNYNQTLSCSKDSDSSAITVSSNSISMPSDSAVTCTFSNSRIAQQLSLNKQWQNGATGHTISVTSTGGTNNPTLSSTSSGNNSTTGTALTVYAGDSVTLPAETFGGGGSAAQYNSTLACSGGTTLASGAVNRSITITNSTTATVCTYNNARKSATLTVRKVWSANSKAGDTTTVSSSGFASNATSGSSVATAAGNTTTGTAVTVYAGESGTISEAFSVGSASNYNAVTSCSGNTQALSGNTLTIDPADTAVVCTITNTRIAQQLSLNKQWQNGASGHTINVTSTGGTNNPTLSSTSSGNNSTTGTALTVYAGDSVTLPAETFGGGATAGQYTSTLACSGGSTLASGAVNRSITISNSTTATVCTYNNARKSATLTVRKVWAANSNAGDTTTVSSSGFGAVATSGSSVATAAGNSTTGTAVTVYAGESGTISEAFSVGSPSNYNAVLSCSGNTTALSGNTLTIDPADTAIVCTYTNTRISNAIKLTKAWVNGKTGDAVSLSITGGSSAVTGSSTVGGTTTNATATGLAGNSISFAEAFTTGSGTNYNQSLSCSKDSDSSAIAVTSNSISMPSDSAVTCTFSNSRIAQQLSLNKQWQNGATGHTINVTTTGGTNNPTLSSTSSGNNSTTGTALTVYAGDSVTLPAETFGGGATSSQYNATLACSGGTTLSSGAVNRSITISNSTTATVCTYNNARVSNAIKLTKAWVNGKTGDAVSLSITGGSSAVTGSSTVGGTTTNATATGLAGDSITFAEAFTTGSSVNYNQSLSCSKDSDSSAITVTSNSISMPSDSAVTCTFSNSRIAQQLSLNKQWQNGATGHTINVTTTGGTNNPTLSSTSSGNNSTTGTALMVYAGDSVTLPAETFGGGATSGQYNSTLACSGGTTLASGAVNRSITISNSTTATVCTYNNARVSNGIKLSKTWVNGKTSDAVSLSITGGSSAVAGSSTVGGTTTNATATGLAGDSITFAEAFTTGSGANYNQSLSCSKDSDSSAITVASNSISMPSDSAVNCTFSNSRIAQQLSLNKQWQNGATGHTINVTTTGGTNNPTLSSTSSGNNSTTGTALTVYAGDSVTLPVETFGGGATSGQYNSTLACSGGTTLSSGAVNRSITISNSTTATVCTYNNARKSATLTVRKVWAANSNAGDTVTVSSTGFSTNATSGSSVATAAGNSTTGTAVTVYAGESGTIGEAFSVGSSSNYNAVLSCSGNSQPLSGNTLTIDPADTAITCTETNSRIAQQISLSKQWQFGGFNHTATATTTGGTSNPTFNSTSTGNNTTSGTAVTVYAGDDVTLPAETFGGGASASQYNTTLSCTGGSTLANGLVNRTLTISNSTTATVCSYVNARKGVTLTLVKQWQNGKTSDAATVSTTGFTNNATTGVSVSTGNNSTTGVPATVYVGDVGTISETFSLGSATNYNATLSCTGNSTPLVGNSLTIGLLDTAITCTYNNSRIAQQLSLNKQWQNGATGHTVNVTTTGGTNNPTLNSTSSGNNSTTGTALTVYAGDSVTLPVETFGGGATSGQYNATLACSGGTTLSSGVVNRSITISNSTTATVCTYTNARVSNAIKLSKTWVNGKTNDAVSLSITGGSSAVAGSSTVGGTTTNATATGLAGNSISFAEAFTTGSGTNYNQALSCSKDSDSSAITVTSNSITMPSDSAVTCTFSNSRIAQQLSLNKQWQNGATGHMINVTTTGGTNNPTLSSTSTGNNSSTGTALTVYAGDSVTLPAETFGGGATAGQYNSTLACIGGTTLTSGAVNRSITITNSTTATVCTYNNTRVSNAVKLSKAWVNGKTGDAVSLSITGGSGAVAGSSTVGGTTTNATATGLAGNSISFAEAFTMGSGSNYNQSLSCSKDSDSSAITVNSNSITMPSDSAVTCTFSNSRIAQQLSLNKQWQNGATGHSINVTTTGGTNNPTLSSTSSGNNSTTGTALTVYAGDSVTLPTETFGGGATSGQYNSSLACSGGTTLSSGAVNRSITITNSTTATVCTYSNARKSATLILRKTWVNGIDGDTVTVSSTGFSSNATSGASISTGNNSTSGTAVTVYAGETGTISEVFSTGSAANYNRVLSCTGTTGLSANTLTIGNSDTAIVCTYTNTRVQATVISGRVFTDNSGTTGNASAAYNGVQDTGEAGIAGSKVALTNCASTQIATTTTNASGDYSFSVTPAQLSAPNFCIVQTNLSGYTSVSGTSGYSRSTDTITVANTGATAYSGHNFGDAKLELVLTEDGQKTISPGSVVDYPHRLIASSVLNVNNLVQTLTQQPASAADQPWSALVYRDSNCNGVVDAGESAFNPASAAVSMLPGQEVCLVQRVNSPANASSGAQHIGRLQASYAVTLADSSQLTGSSNQRQDTTLIGSAGLTMAKQVRVVASCPSTGADTNPFATQNQASKGDYLEYEITYRNNSTRNLVDIVIKDSVPLGTSFQSMACTVTPVSSCTPLHSGDALSWQTTGLLAPAREGKVRFCTRVQ